MLLIVGSRHSIWTSSVKHSKVESTLLIPIILNFSSGGGGLALLIHGGKRMIHAESEKKVVFLFNQTNLWS